MRQSRPSLLAALVPRSVAQWMAILGLVPFGAGAWIQARDQREIRIAQVAVDERLGELERRLDRLTDGVGAAGVQVGVTDTAAAGSDSLPARAPFEATDTRGVRGEAATLAREFDRLTRLREDLRARRGALTGVRAPANVLLAVGALVTLAGVLTDLRQFRQLRRRPA